MASFGELLEELRRDKKLTQEELGNALGVASSTIGGYEHSRYEPPYCTLVSIANYFNVSTDYLLGITRARENTRTLFKDIQVDEGQIPVDLLVEQLKCISQKERSSIINLIQALSKD